MHTDEQMKMSDEDWENYYPVITNVRSCNMYCPTGYHIHATVYTL